MGRGMDRNKSILSTDPKFLVRKGTGAAREKRAGHLSGQPAALIPGVGSRCAVSRPVRTVDSEMSLKCGIVRFSAV